MTLFSEFYNLNKAVGLYEAVHIPSSTTWTAPYSGWYMFTACSAGGGGGSAGSFYISGGSSYISRGGGGGGAGRTARWRVFLLKDTTVSFVIGAGGLGGLTPNGTSGSAGVAGVIGGTTTVTCIAQGWSVTIPGGNPGGAGSSVSVSGPAGLGSSTGSFTGPIEVEWLNGGAGSDAISLKGGGGGAPSCFGVLTPAATTVTGAIASLLSYGQYRLYRNIALVGGTSSTDGGIFCGGGGGETGAKGTNAGDFGGGGGGAGGSDRSTAGWRGGTGGNGGGLIEWNV